MAPKQVEHPPGVRGPKPELFAAFHSNTVFAQLFVLPITTFCMCQPKSPLKLPPDPVYCSVK
ncbi:hypothetical protein D3C85_928090 [compost metagenome]